MCALKAIGLGFDFGRHLMECMSAMIKKKMYVM